ncbi:MAG TPA: dienelactone hydrolase family protein [Candidatus Sulfopaludibacter sp.]|nr:dienelactone hydrolase family protein [Candidatus Sulfopaludibacter sp.]
MSTATHTDSQGLVAGFVMIPARGGELPAYRALPAQPGKFPVVLVIQEIFGVHHYIQDVCRRLAKLGYCAIAPELYFRIGDSSAVTDWQEIRDNFVAPTPDEQVMADLDACAAFAEASGQGDLGCLYVTGFCWGGRMTWFYAAHNPRLKGAVAWYGRLAGEKNDLHPRNPIDAAGDLKCPVLGLYGGLDKSIPIDQVEAMRAKGADIVVYPEADHAFHADYRPTYNQAASADGWRRLREFFEAHR